MVKFNLQLFAKKPNTSTSIVDYLNSSGQDSSYSARKELAKNLGISNYSGTAEQNTAMLKALQGGSQSSAKNSAPTNTNVAGSAKSSINGVDQATINRMNSTFQKSDKVSNAQADADASRENLKQLSNVTNIVDQSTWDAINKPFQTSTAYNDAMNFTNQLLQQLSSGKTSYSDDIDALMSDIRNREKFEYDVDNDVLFQQALASAMSSGKTAMQDTMGQASALTGGYGSTYATSAANQAYNAYIEDAYNNLPEYYQMALEAYQMEGEEMYRQLEMLNNASNTEWGRLYDSWGANHTNAQTMYQNEYSAWNDGVNHAISSANLQLNEYGQIYDMNYNTYTALQDNANTLYAQEYQVWTDDVNNAFKYAQIANSDYWDTQNFIEGKRQHDENMDYKYSALKQDQDQFIKSQAQDNAQFYASLASKRSSGSGTSGSDGNLSADTAFSNAEINGIKSAYRDAGGGAAGYEAVDAYLKGIGKYQENEDFHNLVDSYINSADAQEGLPAWYQTWTLTDDTKNRNNPFVSGNEDYNDVYTNLNGSTMTYKELKKVINSSGLSAEEKEKLLKALSGQAKK